MTKTGEKMKYQINDPTTPDLFVDMEPTTSNPQFPYTIRGCQADDQVAIDCKTSLDIALGNLSVILPISHWAASDNLQVWPRAGQDFNAFYDRLNLKFFWNNDPVTNESIYAANSSKVTVHELGHAGLDAYRPDLWSTQCMEIWAFHEGQADITCLYNIMRNDLVIQKAMEETGGNLRLSSIITRLAEQMGNAIWHARGHQDNNLNGLRNAVNDFVFTPPENLPSSAPDNQLSNECHSFGRLIVGTWYDIFVGIYELEKQNSNPIDAFKKARDFIFPCFIKAIINTPVTVRFHEALAKNMIALGGSYQGIMYEVFSKRKIIPTVIKALTQTSKQDMAEKLTNGTTINIGQSEIVVINEPRTLKLSDHITEPKHLKAMFVGGYDLSSCEVEVAAGKYYEFDQSGNLVHEIVPTEDEIIGAAQACVTAIESIGPGPDTMWEVTNNKLMRTFICGR